jgi:type I restriction enzyme S subunit
LEHLIGKAHGGVGLRHVTRREVERLLIPLPDLAEQRRIGAILNEQMAQVEKARAATEGQISEASSLCRRYLLRVFSELLKSSPKTSPLETVTQLLPSKSISTGGEATVETVTTASLTEAGFDQRGIKTAQMAAKDVPDCILSPGEVLVARSNTPELVGRAAMFPGHSKPIVASDLTIRIKARPELLPEFLAGYLSFLYVSKYWVERAGGASGTMKKITRTQIAELPIPVPALEVQERVASQLRKATSAAQQVEMMVTGVLKEIDCLPPAFLRRAFSGEL